MSTHQPDRQQLLHDLNEVSQRNGNLTILFTNALASMLGLSALEFEALSLLGDGPLPAGRLAELCGLTTGAITGLIDRLERAGYAERTHDAEDRRRVMVSLKNEKDLYNRAIELYKPLEAGFNQLTATYSVDDLAIVTNYLKATNTLFEGLIKDLYYKKP